MIPVKILAASLALGGTLLGGNAWGALCASSSMSLGSSSATCEELSGAASAVFRSPLETNIPAPNSVWTSLGFVSGDTSSNGSAFGLDWLLNISSGASNGAWTLQGTGATAPTSVDILAFVLLSDGGGQSLDTYLAFYMTGPTWSDTNTLVGGQFSFSDGVRAVENNGVYVYGLQRTTDPGGGNGGQLPVPEPDMIALFGALGLAFIGARVARRRPD